MSTSEASLSQPDLFLTFFESHALPMWLVEPESGLIVDANPAAVDFYGYSREHLKKMRVHQINQLPANQVAEYIHQAQNQKINHFIFPHRLANGDIRQVEVHTSPIQIGDRELLHSIIHDVTERNHTVKALLASEARLKHLTDAIPGAVYQIRWQQGGAKQMDFMSRGGELLFGLAINDIVMDPELIHQIILDEDLPSFRRSLQRSAELVQPWVHEFRIRHPDGQVKWIRACATPSLEPLTSDLVWFGLFIDVTEQKQLEDQFRHAQRMEAVGTLAGGVAHDFNNLLTAITGYCELLIDDGHITKGGYELVEEIRKATDRATSLTRQLLAFSRKTVISPKLMDLNTVIRDMHRMLLRLISENIDLRIELDPKLDRILADPNQMDQVVMNLVVNARDAMPQGGDLLLQTMNVQRAQPTQWRGVEVPPGHFVRLVVSDTGTGMGAAVLDRLFEPFFTTKTGRGTGLGLATVDTIVRKAGGLIEVHTQLGQGTRFHIDLPSVAGMDGQVKQEVHALSAPKGHETILLVEDQLEVRTLCARVLQLAGYHVLDVENGPQALALSDDTKQEIALLVTDVVMPKMSGRELADRLVKQRPGIKVLYISGYNDDELLQYGIDSESRFFLAKPFTTRTLMAKVRDVLDHGAATN